MGLARKIEQMARSLQKTEASYRAIVEDQADLICRYKTDGRLATEHPLLEDNGDGLGTPPDWFRGIRATKKSADGTLPDGLRAHQFHLVR